MAVEYGAEIFIGEDKGTFRTAGDKEHLEIIRLHVEENRGTNDIAALLKRSSKTIVDHIHFHNTGVEKATFYSKCKRANGTYAQQKAVRQLLSKQENP